MLLALAAAIIAVVYHVAVDNDSDAVPEPWKKLRRGMTKQQVLSLLGEPRTRIGPSTTTVLGLTFTRKEFWEYYGGHWSLLKWRPSDDAYVIYFSPDDKVTSLRRPNRTVSAHALATNQFYQMGVDEGIKHVKERPTTSSMVFPKESTNWSEQARNDYRSGYLEGLRTP